MNTIIIGDVHGCLHELEALLNKLKLKAADEVLFVGDLVDKGPFSREVVDLIQSIEGVCVRGNHEDKHIRYRRHLQKQRADPKYRIPMTPPEWFLETHAKLSDEDIAWFASMPVSLRLGELGAWEVVHGGPMHGAEMFLRYVDKQSGKMVPFDGDYSQPPNTVFWTEDPGWNADHFVVYGHHPWPVVRRERKTFGIDTGCVYGGKLTALVFDGPPRDNQEPKVVQVDAWRAYERKIAA